MLPTVRRCRRFPRDRFRPDPTRKVDKPGAGSDRAVFATGSGDRIDRHGDGAAGDHRVGKQPGDIGASGDGADGERAAGNDHLRVVGQRETGQGQRGEVVIGDRAGAKADAVAVGRAPLLQLAASLQRKVPSDATSG